MRARINDEEMVKMTMLKKVLYVGAKKTIRKRLETGTELARSRFQPLV